MASPRTWNKTVSATSTVTNSVVGGSSPFGPSTIGVNNTSTTDSCWVCITNMGANSAAVDATATLDGTGNSWQVAAGKEHFFNLGTQDSTEKYNVSVIMASGKSATVILNAIQAQ